MDEYRSHGAATPSASRKRENKRKLGFATTDLEYPSPQGTRSSFDPKKTKSAGYEDFSPQMKLGATIHPQLASVPEGPGIALVPSFKAGSPLAPNLSRYRPALRQDVLQFSVNYAALDEERDEIRLVEILPGNAATSVECRTYKLGLNEAAWHPYKALSYTWGSMYPLNQAQTIILDGQDFKVTTNLWEALRHLRSKDIAQLFWIDAICINQSNVLERNSQVKKMGTIYEFAEEVITWLGGERDDSRLAFDFLKKAMDYDKGVVKDNLFAITPIFVKAWNALNALSCREYWNRVWIIQEVLCATKISIRCGYDKVPWSAFTNFRRRCASSFLPGSIAYYYAEFARSPAVRIDEQRATRAPDRSLLQLLESSRLSRSGEPRDRIFALLGLANDPFLLKSFPDRLSVDYEISTFALYTRIVRLYAAKDRVHVCELLQCLFKPSSPSPSSEIEFPRSRDEVGDERLIDAIGYLVGTVENVHRLDLSGRGRTIFGSDEPILIWTSLWYDDLPAPAVTSGLISRLPQFLDYKNDPKPVYAQYITSEKTERLLDDPDIEQGRLAVREQCSLRSLRDKRASEGNTSAESELLQVFYTKSGLFGVVHGQVKVGDEIYMFEGSHVALTFSPNNTSGGNAIVGRALVIRPDRVAGLEHTHKGDSTLLDELLFCFTKEELRGDALTFGLSARTWQALSR